MQPIQEIVSGIRDELVTSKLSAGSGEAKNLYGYVSSAGLNHSQAVKS